MKLFNFFILFIFLLTFSCSYSTYDAENWYKIDKKYIPEDLLNSTNLSANVIYNYLETEIKYKNNYSARSLNDVLKNGYGDCRDKSFLLLALSFLLLDEKGYFVLKKSKKSYHSYAEIEKKSYGRNKNQEKYEISNDHFDNIKYIFYLIW